MHFKWIEDLKTILYWPAFKSCLAVEHLLGNPPKVTHEPVTRIISKQLDIKLGLFTLEELDSVLRKIKNRKAAGLDMEDQAIR